MSGRDRETYQVSKIRYMIPLLAGLLITLAGIIMTILNHHAYGKSEEYNQPTEITGPQAIVLGVIIILISLRYRWKLYKEIEELNRKQR